MLISITALVWIRVLRVPRLTSVSPLTRRRALEPKQQVRSIRILLRPGKYVLKQAIHVQAVPGVAVSLETVQLPPNVYRPPASSNSVPLIMEQALPLETPASPPSPPRRAAHSTPCAPTSITSYR